MNSFPTVDMKLREFGIEEKLDAYNKANAEIDIIRQVIQDEMMDILWDKYSIDPMLWFYNPDEPYFRMRDHQKRKLPPQHYVRIVMNDNHPNCPMMNIKIGTNQPMVCKNINTLVETVQLQNYLLQALKNPEIQNLISLGYMKIKQTIQNNPCIHKYHQASRDAQYLEKTSKYCEMMMNLGINTPIELNQWLNSMNTEQIKKITNYMGLTPITSHLNQKQKLIQIINKFYCIPNPVN